MWEPDTPEGEDFRPEVPISRDIAIQCLNIAMRLGLVRPLVGHRTPDGQIGCIPAPPADIAKLETSLKAAGVAHRIEWYPAVEHGFVFPKRAGIYNAPAAERHWERLFSLFKRTLQ